jgi:predicted metallo-beta-lactamase superfamily hydrolase
MNEQVKNVLMSAATGATMGAVMVVLGARDYQVIIAVVVLSSLLIYHKVVRDNDVREILQKIEEIKTKY